MPVMRSRFLLLVTAALLSPSCAARTARFEHVDVSQRWTIMQDKPGETYVLLKNTRDLETALKRVGCNPRSPCAIGRLGELYVVSRPAREKAKQ
jgi:hypothetical protein